MNLDSGSRRESPPTTGRRVPVRALLALLGVVVLLTAIWLIVQPQGSAGPRVPDAGSPGSPPSPAAAPPSASAQADGPGPPTITPGDGGGLPPTGGATGGGSGPASIFPGADGAAPGTSQGTDRSDRDPAGGSPVGAAPPRSATVGGFAPGLAAPGGGVAPGVAPSAVAGDGRAPGAVPYPVTGAPAAPPVEPGGGTPPVEDGGGPALPVNPPDPADPVALVSGPTLTNSYPAQWGVFSLQRSPECAAVKSSGSALGIDAEFLDAEIVYPDSSNKEVFDLYDPDPLLGCTHGGQSIPAETPACRSGPVIRPNLPTDEAQCVIGLTTNAPEGTDWTATLVYTYRGVCTSTTGPPCDRREVRERSPSFGRPVVVTWKQTSPVLACFADPEDTSPVGPELHCPVRDPSTRMSGTN